MKNTVKIDKDLLERVGRLIKKKDKKIKYAHQKQFIDIAVLKLLEEEENRDRANSDSVELSGGRK